MKINTHLINLVQQILSAISLCETGEVDRLKSLAIDDIIKNNYKHQPSTYVQTEAQIAHSYEQALPYATDELDIILKLFILND